MKNIVFVSALFLMPVLNAVPGPQYPPNIEIFDSKTDPTMVYVLYDDTCVVSMTKAAFSDVNYVVDLIEKSCGVIDEKK